MGEELKQPLVKNDSQKSKKEPVALIKASQKSSLKVTGNIVKKKNSMAITVSKAGSAHSVTSSHSLSDEDEEAEFEKNKHNPTDFRPTYQKRNRLQFSRLTDTNFAKVQRSHNR